MLRGPWIYRKFGVYRDLIHYLKKAQIPLMGGLPVYWVLVFFFRNLSKESINLRASSIAFNLFLSLFPALIFLFTLLPYIPVEGLGADIMIFMKVIMPAAAFTEINETLQDILANPNSGLLSFGIIASLYFGSNGIYSLTQTFNKNTPHSFWKEKLRAISLTITLGVLLITGLCLFIVAQFAVEMLIYDTSINDNLLYYVVILLQWIILFVLILGGITILYRHGDISSEKWRYIFPGAILASLLSVVTSIVYAYYVESYGNYNRLYGSLGAIIITMLWIYFNSMVLIIGHDFNRSLIHTRLSMMSKEKLPVKKADHDSLEPEK
jgi:membrane protein